METTAAIPDLSTHSDFLRRMATRLVRDANEADDAVQDAFVAAIEKPPALLGSPRAWLTAVLKNRIRMRKRSEARRGERERAVSRAGEEISSLEAAASVETARRLVDEVAALDEPYRSVVVLRYYHDLRFAEIGARLGRPVATVRTQHHRALAMLRERLDRRWRGRRAWVVALLPLARSRAAPSGVIAALAAAVLIVLCAIPFFAGTLDPAPRPVSPPPDPAPAIVADHASGDRTADATAEGRADPRDPHAPIPDDVAVITLTDETGRPVAGVRVSLLLSPISMDTYVPADVVDESVSDDHGRVRFDVEPFSRHPVKAVHPDYAVGGDLYCYGGVVTDFRLHRPAVLTGVVRDGEFGRPLPGATVYAMDWGGAGVLHEWRTRTDEAGRYRIVGLGKGYYNIGAWGAGTQHGVPKRPMHIEAGREHVLDFDLVRSPPLVLRVVDGATGQPLPEVTVKWMQHEPITGPGESLPTLPFSGAWQTSMLVTAPGWHDRSVKVPKAALRTPETPFLIRMTRCVPVTGRVMDAGGEPVPDADVRFIVRGIEDREIIIVEVPSGEDGRFRSDCGLPGGSVRIEVHASRETVLIDTIRPVPADATEFRFGAVVVPRTATISGRVLDPDGVPVTSGVVRVGMPNSERLLPLTEAWIDPRGRFRLPGVPLGDREIVLADVAGVPVQVREETVRGDLRFDWTIPAGQTITGRVVDEQGRPVPLKFIVLEPGEALVRGDQEGRFRFRGLPAGNFRLSFRNHPRKPALEVPGNSYDVEFRLILP